ncbi:hypothetical protein FNF29_04412 [Cafeteria roenbergensis]|uniref:Uncharacterized protein n=1 Tax=Cafeteria roenbergensis TaxID=33653 RepID=A0A5A8CGI3_CAFRO|nr:hypothetical protein FNF29_04412 [Cafeteria roenbergensis]|eukprot:KAA0151727.1 hypothetical protein FNF29_04412 [Cafeteria roenbergensis]
MAAGEAGASLWDEDSDGSRDTAEEAAPGAPASFAREGASESQDADDSHGDDDWDQAPPSGRASFGGSGAAGGFGSEPPLRFETSAAAKSLTAHRLAAPRVAEQWVPGQHWMSESVAVAVPMRLSAEQGALGFGTRVVLTDCGVVVDRGGAEGCARAAAACGLSGLPCAESRPPHAGGIGASVARRASEAASARTTSGGLALVDPSSGQRVPLPEADEVFGSLADGEAMSSGWLPACKGGSSFLPCLVRAAAAPGSWTPQTAVYSFRARAWLRVDAAASASAASALARVGASVTTMSRAAAGSSSQPAMLVIGGAFPDLRGLVGAVEAVSMKDDPACEADVVLRSAPHKTATADDDSVAGGPHPSLRVFHAAAQTAEGRVAVFGGLVPKPALSGPSLATLASLVPSGDLWELDLPSKRWARLGKAARGDPPSPRIGPALAVVGDALFVAGGASVGPAGRLSPLHDVSVLSLTTMAWSRVSVSAHPLLGRSLRLGLSSACTLSLGDAPVIVLGGPTTGSADGEVTARGREPHVVVVALPSHPLEDLAGAMQRLAL